MRESDCYCNNRFMEKKIKRNYLGNISFERAMFAFCKIKRKINCRVLRSCIAVNVWLRLLRHVCATCNSHARRRAWYYKFKCSTHIVRVMFPRGDLSQSRHFRTRNCNPLYRYVNTADGDLAEVSPEHTEQWTVSFDDWNADLDAD